MKKLILVAIGLALSSSAFAAKHKIKTIPLGEPVAFTTTYSPDQFNEMVKHYKVRRSTASTDSIDENKALTAQFRNIRNSFIGGTMTMPNGNSKAVPGAKTAADIDALLNTVDAQMKAGQITETDAKLLAAQLLVLKPFRSLVARMHNIFEANGRNAKFSHAMAVTALRFSAAGIAVYLPTDQWEAGFQYLVQPSYISSSSNQSGCDSDTGWHAQCDIPDGAAYQAWLRNELLPRLVNLNNVLAGFKLDTKNIYWDNKILYGSADFVSSKDRFLRMGEPERLTLLASTQAMISGIYGVSAYDLSYFFDSIDKMATVYGFSTLYDAGSATSQERYNAVRAYPGLFQLKHEAHTQDYLNNAYFALKTSLQNAHMAWLALQSLQNSSGAQDNFIDPRLVGPSRRIMNTGFANAFQLVGIDQNGAELAQGEVVSALFNGEKVTVKLKEFFSNPPNSLQDFMPTAFEGGSDTKNDVVINGVTAPYRNYLRGRPTAWNYSVYNRYFPGTGSANDVKRNARVMAQSWGGFLLGVPLSLVMM